MRKLAIPILFWLSIALQAASGLDVKGFLEHPPAIREYSAIIKGDSERPLYYFVRWQEGDFVVLFSHTDTEVLAGKIKDNSEAPYGLGKYGAYYWFFYGNSQQVHAIEWEGMEENMPPEVKIQFDAVRNSQMSRLLNLWCAVAPVGSLKWDDGWSHVVHPKGSFNVQLLCNESGKVLGARRTYGGAVAEKKMTAQYTQLDFIYGSGNIPPGFPIKIRRSLVDNQTNKLTGELEVHHLLLATDRLVREDFLPQQFVADSAKLKFGKFNGNNKVLNINGKSYTIKKRAAQIADSNIPRTKTVIYIGFAGVTLAAIVFILCINRNTKQTSK